MKSKRANDSAHERPETNPVIRRMSLSQFRTVAKRTEAPHFRVRSDGSKVDEGQKLAGQNPRMGELFVAQQMIANGEATAERFAGCGKISEALLTSAMTKCRWEGRFLMAS
jgi:hypothetical protein